MQFAKQVKRRRGTEAENAVFTGAEGEIVVDTTNHKLRVHDGATQGGFGAVTDVEFETATTQINQALGLKADDTAVVHKAGNETIGGEKIFSDYINAKIKKNNDNNKHNGLNIVDENGIRYGIFRAGEKNNTRYLSINIVNSENVIKGSLECNINSDGRIVWKVSPTPNNAINNEITTAAWVRNLVSSSAGVPAGTIVAFAGATVPAGWLWCDGSAISRTTYAPLFAAISTIYGAGDGNSTFNLPDARDVALFWSTAASLRGTRTRGMLPNIEGSFGFMGGQWGNPGFGLYTGSFAAQKIEPGRDTSGDGYRDRVSQLSFSAARSSSAYNSNDNLVVPASLFIGGFIIKY